MEKPQKYGDYLFVWILLVCDAVWGGVVRCVRSDKNVTCFRFAYSLLIWWYYEWRDWLHSFRLVQFWSSFVHCSLSLFVYLLAVPFGSRGFCINFPYLSANKSAALVIRRRKCQRNACHCCCCSFWWFSGVYYFFLHRFLSVFRWLFGRIYLFIV